MDLAPVSQIIITSDFKSAIARLQEVAPPQSRFELFIKEDENFLVSDANEVIAKAYLASKERVFICLASQQFSDVVQNRLLKIIEEPPRNTEFILLTPLKSALLPTIKSRLIVTHFKTAIENRALGLDLSALTLQSVYDFLQANRYLKPKDAIAVVESIITQAILSERFDLDEDTLTLFGDVRYALNVGSPTDFVLTTLLLKLLAKAKKRVRR